MAQRGKYPKGGKHTARDVPQAPQGIDDRPPPRLAGPFVDAGHGFGHARVGGPVAIGGRSRCPESGDGGVDDAGIASRDLIVSEPESLECARLLVLDEDVATLCKPNDEIRSTSEVDGHAALIEIVAEERRTDFPAIRSPDRRHGSPTGIAVGRILDLDHVSAQPRQKFGWPTAWRSCVRRRGCAYLGVDGKEAAAHQPPRHPSWSPHPTGPI